MMQPEKPTPTLERVLIAGSRGYSHWDAVKRLVESLKPDTLVISGAANGVDKWAATAARAKGLQVEEYPADWATYGRRAGAMRNAVMVDLCHRACVFWDEASPGSKVTIGMLRRSGKPFTVYGREATVIELVG